MNNAQQAPARLYSVIAATCASFFFGTAALAEDSIKNVRGIEVEVSGSVRESCAVGMISDIDFRDLERPGHFRQANVRFDCNVPFSMTITGSTGALSHASMPRGQGPYVGSVPYEVSVQMPLRFPSARTLTRTFESQQLLSGGVINSQGGIAVDGMILSVEVATLPPHTLLAGNYSETITITVNPT